MATLSVWKFSSPAGADEALGTLEKLSSEQLIQVHDYAVVTWPPGNKKPKTREMRDTTKRGALGGGFWGLLFGLIFFVPILGLAIGAGMGALFGSLTDVGINDAFIKDVREKVTPGSSALFVMTSDAVQDRVADAFADTQAELIRTNLSNEQEDRLREAFGQED